MKLRRKFKDNIRQNMNEGSSTRVIKKKVRKTYGCKILETPRMLLTSAFTQNLQSMEAKQELYGQLQQLFENYMHRQ